MASTKRYFFAQDNDGHWYQIPADRREEWNRLLDIDDAWELPEWEEFETYQLDGGIEHITFFQPMEEAV